MAEQGGRDAEKAESCRLRDRSGRDRDGDVGIAGVNARIVVGDAAAGDREIECSARGEGIVVAEVVVAEEDVVGSAPQVSKAHSSDAVVVHVQRELKTGKSWEPNHQRI